MRAFCQNKKLHICRGALLQVGSNCTKYKVHPKIVGLSNLVLMPCHARRSQQHEAKWLKKKGGRGGGTLFSGRTDSDVHASYKPRRQVQKVQENIHSQKQNMTLPKLSQGQWL